MFGECQVIEFNYWYFGFGMVCIFVGVEMGGVWVIQMFVEMFQWVGYVMIDFSVDVMVKMYVCYMVGGMVVFDYEVFYCFEFLE